MSKPLSKVAFKLKLTDKVPLWLGGRDLFYTITFNPEQVAWAVKHKVLYIDQRANDHLNYVLKQVIAYKESGKDYSAVEFQDIPY